MKQSVALMALIASTGCPKGPPVQAAYHGGATPAPDEPTPPADEPAKDAELVARMHESFGVVERIHAAVVRGDLASAHSQAASLIKTAHGSGRPDSWQPHLDALHAEAAKVGQADALATASAAVARLVSACGGCHRALAAKVELPEPPEPDGPEARMQMHAWGVQRMWEGLVVPSGDRFLRGTTTFAALPSCEAKPNCERLKRIANRSHVADDDQSRVELYGRLLATCADCHATER